MFNARHDEGHAYPGHGQPVHIRIYPDQRCGPDDLLVVTSFPTETHLTKVL